MKTKRLVYWQHGKTWFCNRAGHSMCSWGDTKDEAKASWLLFEKG